MRVTLLITTFMRNNLLKWGLESIARQGMKDIQVLVLNDGCDDSPKAICDAYGAEYLRTNLSNAPRWRIPGFALNIGAKRAKGDIIIISCAEMYHINNCIELLLRPFENDDKIMSIPSGKHDTHGVYLKELENKQDTPSKDIYDSIPELRSTIPFLLALHRKYYLDIGGYDEDFIGQAFDDDDIVWRLRDAGLKYVHTKAQVVHLFHAKNQAGRQEDRKEKWLYNNKLFEQRRGVIRRNVGRDWGVLR